MNNNIALIVLGCLCLGWVQFATVLIAYSATQAKSKPLGVMSVLCWLILAFLCSVIVIDQFILLPWLEETNFHVCGK